MLKVYYTLHWFKMRNFEPYSIKKTTAILLGMKISLMFAQHAIINFVLTCARVK